MQREHKLDAEGVKTALERIVDEHAQAKVDRIVHCGFVLPWGTVPPGLKSFDRLPEKTVESNLYKGLFDPDTETGIRQLEEAGYDFFQVLLEQSHKKGVQFLVGMRMNDLHGGSGATPFCTEHPEWMARSPDFWLDYKHEGVRKAVLAVASEFLDRYDVDGIELDWMRFCYMFSRPEAVQNAPILTDFTAQMRKLLDQAAKKRGRDKLLLGVRVPSTMEECRLLGYDVKAWVQQGLVDFICPMDFSKTDYNTSTEDFTALTKGTQRKVYPTVHPQYVDYTVRPTITDEYPVMHTAENYRAAAKNFYAFGADGVSAYNYQDHWIVENHTDEWPRTMSYLTGLRSPAAVARGDRHYMFYPFHPHFPGVVDKHQNFVLHRRTGNPVATFPDPSESTRFRMAEDLTDPNLSATLKFKVTGMTDGDEFEVALNGEVIPAGQFERTLDDERSPQFYLYQTPLSSPPAKFGDNELRLRLTKSVGTERLGVYEIEVNVRDNGRVNGTLPDEKKNEGTKQEAQDVDTGVEIGGEAGAAASIPAVKAVVLINPNNGFGDWRPNKVLQMSGETVARELPAEHQLICDGTTPKTPEFDPG